MIDNKPLAYAESFKYLGSVLSADTSINAEISHRISKEGQPLERWKQGFGNVMKSVQTTNYQSIELLFCQFSSAVVRLGLC